MEILLDSVAPDVKIIYFGSQLIRSAIFFLAASIAVSASHPY
jgi:hypothetical protein